MIFYLLDAIPIEANQGVCGNHNLLIVIVDTLKRFKFTLCIVLGQDIAYLDVQSLVGSCGYEVYLTGTLFSNVYGPASPKQLQVHYILQYNTGILVTVSDRRVA
ncbi:MAG: hypothetical protein PHH86_05390 [Sphaerochaetaceae bacterium]|jgi:hypothetical protein|nr:hypothetical protein [Sphaerochaetaceae bacterium]